MTNEEISALVDKLEQNLHKLAPGNQGFARSLCHWFKAKGYLSDKQIPHLVRFAALATGEEQPEVPKPVNVAGAYKLFENAKAHLKYPAIVFNSGECTIKLSLASSRARAPGTINVVCGGLWIGRIQQNGDLNLFHGEQKVREVVTKFLVSFADDPEKVACDHGKLTGRCCFCNTKLTDKRSTEVGYGQTCAKHYGLRWGSKPAPQPKRDPLLELFEELPTPPARETRAPAPKKEPQQKTVTWTF